MTNRNLSTDNPLSVVPQAVELERAVLGAIIVEGEVLASVIPVLSPEMFYDPVHEALFREMLQLYDARQPIDMYTLGQRIRSNDRLAGLVKIIYLAELGLLVGSGANVMAHAMIVKERYLAREMKAAGMRITSMAGDGEKDIADLLAACTNEIDRINEIAAGKRLAGHIRASAEKAMKEAERRTLQSSSGKTSGIPTGLRDHDKLTGGWQPSTLNIIAARPAMGKTALMLHYARQAAEAGFPGCIYSLEMSDVSLAGRMLLSLCDVEANRFRFGALRDEDWKKLNAAQGSLEKLPIYIDDNPVVSMRYIKAHASVMRRKGICDWIMIDYLQLTDMGGVKNRNREQEVAQTSRQAKIIAKELGIPVILLSQLSRAVEGRADKRPQLSDLRESGAIEQDADTVTFIHRPAYYRIDTVPSKSHGMLSTSNLGLLYVEKQRDGATGSVKFLHNASMTQITDFSKSKQAELIDRENSQTDISNSVDNIPF